LELGQDALHLAGDLVVDPFVAGIWPEALDKVDRGRTSTVISAGIGSRPGRSRTVRPNGGASATGNTLIRVSFAQPVTSAARSPRVANSAVS
jgi:hypothetical protein